MTAAERPANYTGCSGATQLIHCSAQWYCENSKMVDLSYRAYVLSHTVKIAELIAMR